MTQLSNVPMQPNPNTVERPLTLIEKLEREYQKWCELEDKSEFGSGEAIDARGRTRGLKDAIDIVKQHSQETCNWRNNKGTGLWECHYGGDYTSDCGLEWNMSNKDSQSENEMHFCPKCGKKLVEVQPTSEVQDD